MCGNIPVRNTFVKFCGFIVIIFFFSGHKGTIWSLAIHDGKLISSSSDGTLKVWDAADLRKGCLKTVPGHNEAVSAL